MTQQLTSNQSTLKFKNGIKDGFPIGLAYFSVSVAFGVQASLLGVPTLIAVFTSMANLTSAGQLAGIQIIALLGSFLEIALTQLVINSRYFLMSITLSQKLDDTFTTPKRFFYSTFITDEIFAVAVSKPQKVCTKYFAGLALLPYVGWALGTLIGALLGNILPASITSALGIALYAMFIAIITSPIRESKGVLPTILLGAGLSCAFYYIPFLSKISSGTSMMICAILTALIIAAIFPIKSDDEKETETKAEAVSTDTANITTTDSTTATTTADVIRAEKMHDSEEDEK